MSKPDADPESIQRVTAALNLQHEVIHDVGGLDALIGILGSIPSAGQRQVIYVALPISAIAYHLPWAASERVVKWKNGLAVTT